MGNLFGVTKVIETVGSIASDLITTDKEREQLRLEEKRIDQATDLAQMEVNKAEAAHPSIFVAGGRPFIIWVGGFALAYQFIIYPLLLWLLAMAKGFDIVPMSLEPPPVLPTDALWVVLSGVLGISSMRSFDKSRGTDTKGTK